MEPERDFISTNNWLEISLTVDGEMAEAVAEVLARFIPDGVVIESTDIIPDPTGEGTPAGPLRVYGYLPANQESVRDQSLLEDTRRRIEEALYYLSCIKPLSAPTFRLIQDTDWSKAWKQHYHPIPVGKRLMIIPAWLDTPPQGRLPIRIDPGMAFGTGTHPTTQLCLEFLEELMEEGGRNSVIDLGTGSGILAIAAAKLGAGQVLGLDNDAQAIPIARQNAAMNGLEIGIEFAVGSLEEALSGMFALRKASIVLVNILAPIIIRLLDDGLAKLLEPDGVLVLSGILDSQLSGSNTAAEIAVLPALERHGLSTLQIRQIKDWAALIAVK